MYQEKIIKARAIAIESIDVAAGASRQPIDLSARFAAVMIVLGLPLILVWLLARFLWNDVKAIARGVAVFWRGAAEELSRR